jgi:hypothetical protein
LLSVLGWTLLIGGNIPSLKHLCRGEFTCVAVKTSSETARLWCCGWPKRRYSQSDMFSMEWLISDGGIAIRNLKNLGRMLNIIDNQSNRDDDLYGRFASVTSKIAPKPP